MDLHQLSPTAYLERLRSRPLAVLAQPQPTDYQHTVASTWSLAMEDVAHDELAAASMYLAAFLAPADISAELFEQVNILPQPPDAIELDAALTKLRGYSLLTGNGRVLTMHPMVQLVAREHLEAGSRRHWIQTAVDVIAQAFPSDAANVQVWPSCQELLPHALAVVAYATSEPVKTAQLVQLVDAVAVYFHARGDMRSATEHGQRAVTLAAEVFELTDPRGGPPRDTLGAVLTQAGALDEAYELHKQSLTLQRAALGERDPALVRTLGSMGVVLFEQRRLHAARQVLERAVVIGQSANARAEDLAVTVGNLGNVLFELKQLRSARRMHERALQLKVKIWGHQHPDVAISLGALGIVEAELGDLRAARRLQEQALAIEEAAFGPEHPEVGRTLGNLARVLGRDGQVTEACDLLKRAVGIFESVYGNQHAITVQAKADRERLGCS